MNEWKKICSYNVDEDHRQVNLFIYVTCGRPLAVVFLFTSTSDDWLARSKGGATTATKMLRCHKHVDSVCVIAVRARERRLHVQRFPVEFLT